MIMGARGIKQPTNEQVGGCHYQDNSWPIMEITLLGFTDEVDDKWLGWVVGSVVCWSYLQTENW